MRIIAGSRKSRLLKSLPGLHTRPTLDKVKEAAFGRLGPWIEGKRVLDLFAGSGNIGLEALSRGAHECSFVDGSKEAIRIIDENIQSLDFKNQSHVYRMDAFQACRYFKNKGLSFDLVYCDPPFGKVDLQKLWVALLPITHLESRVILEHPHLDDLQLESSYQLEKHHSYGTVHLYELRRTV